MIPVPSLIRRRMIAELLDRAYDGNAPAFQAAIVALAREFRARRPPPVLFVDQATLGADIDGVTVATAGTRGTPEAMILLRAPRTYSRRRWLEVVVHEMVHAAAYSHRESWATGVERRFVAGLPRARLRRAARAPARPRRPRRARARR